METNEENYHVLTLEKIASWQISTLEIKSEIKAIKAGIPSLQRGAVWEPQQIEMLWDSILRGFPIGSIVVSQKIKYQNDKKPITLAKDSNKETIAKEINEETTHHILDGQQRCNAIAWGFVDPWDESLSDDIVLWLDIKPEKRLEGSSRKYLFRVTTKAHPWGFKHDDNSSYLSTQEIRNAMDEIDKLHKVMKEEPKFSKLITDNNFEKTTPKLAFPHDAGFPVPVSLLIKYKKEKLNFNEFLEEPIIKVIKEATKKEISKEVSLEDFNSIMEALSIIEKTRLVALEVPSGIEEEVDDIEQIFQRLNRQGTPLDNEELAYSIIKAHWANVEGIISSLPNNLRHSTEARLVSLGVRVALTEVAPPKDEDKKISAEQTPKQIRDIFTNKNNKEEEKRKIQQFFENDLEKSLQWIDNNLLYDKLKRNYGLPKYLRSSIAWRSRDVFAWLMLLAKQFEFNPINDHQKAKKIIGFALTIHWFGVDKSDAVNFLLSEVSTVEKIDNFEISTLKDKSGKKTFIHIPLSPKDMNAALQLNNDSFENWKNFWQGMVVHDAKENSDNNEEKRKSNYFFVTKVSNEKELLIYAQRAYIESKFSDFDPSNKLIWKGFNRPWDYDHILPSSKIGGTGKGKNKYTDICQAWKGSIGNLTAVDFSFNRSVQDKDSAEEKYSDKKENGFNIFTTKLDCFNITHEETKYFEVSQGFVCAAKERLIKIYAKWYKTLAIG